MSTYLSMFLIECVLDNISDVLITSLLLLSVFLVFNISFLMLCVSSLRILIIFSFLFRCICRNDYAPTAYRLGRLHEVGRPLGHLLNSLICDVLPLSLQSVNNTPILEIIREFLVSFI